jgi:hypothetical protein
MPSTASIDVRHTVAQRAAVSGVGGVLIRPNNSNLLAKKGSGTTRSRNNPLLISAAATTTREDNKDTVERWQQSWHR